MNQQIKQLALQAKFGSVIALNHYGTVNALTQTEQAQLEQIQKFAELIIAQCASIVRNTNLEDVEGGDSAVLNAASDQIKSFFKV
jgi:hypothetical protein